MIIEKLAEFFLIKQAKAKPLSVEELELYKYGYILLMEVIINIVCALLIGSFFGRLCEIGIFLFSFVLLRIYSGGFHAKTSFKCLLLSCLMFVFVSVILREEWLHKVNNLIPFVFEILFVVLIFLRSPVESVNKRLGERECKRLRKKIKLVLVIEAVVGIVLYVLNYPEFVYAIHLAHVCAMLSMMSGIIDNKRQGL